MAPETQMERIYDLKRARTAVPKTFWSRVRAARQRETVKASIPSRAQLKGSIPRHAPLECLFSGPRRDSVYLNTTCQTPPPGYGARNGRQNPYHLSRTLSAARAPPCGGLMTESGRVFACDVIVDDSSRVLCPAAARDRAIEEILELAAPGLERDARRPM